MVIVNICLNVYESTSWWYTIYLPTENERASRQLLAIFINLDINHSSYILVNSAP